MKYVMIGGLMRSGTTLVANFLNSQNNVTLYRDFLISLRLFESKELLHIKDYTKNILLTQLKEELMTTAQKSVVYERNNINDICDIFTHSLNHIASLDDVIVGIKLTESMEFFHILSNCKLKDIKFIYIVRDIRDVLLSGNNMFNNYNQIRAIYQWKKEIKEIYELQKKLSSKNVIIIRYEDFVTKNCNEELESFLNISLNWNITKFKDRNNEIWFNNSSFENMEKQQGISDKALYRWKSKIENDIYLQLASVICKEEILQLEYESSNIQLNLLIKIKLIVIYKIKNKIKEIGKKLYKFMSK